MLSPSIMFDSVLWFVKCLPQTVLTPVSPDLSVCVCVTIPRLYLSSAILLLPYICSVPSQYLLAT